MHEPLENQTINDTRKVDLGKRIVAFLIDATVAGIGGAIVGFFFPALSGLVVAGYFLVRDGLELEFMNGRSFGKHVMNLHVVRHNGEKMDVETSMRRNWMFALNGAVSFTLGLGFLSWLISLAGTIIFIYEIYRISTRPDGRRWGDDLADTEVVGY